MSPYALVVGLALVAAQARAEQPELGVFGGAGYLGSPGTEGTAVWGGLRLGLARHLAASVDVGYGLVGANVGMQDRWWAMPSVAGVLDVKRVRLELGAGGGVGTSSGYVSWPAYAAGPFAPVWHYTVPAVRAYLSATTPVREGIDVLIRTEAATLILPGTHGPASDVTWFALWLGVQSRLL